MTKQAIIDLIHESEIEQAIDALKNALPGNNDVILQAGRWKGLVKDMDKGLLDQGFYRMEKNRITQALLGLAEKVKDAAGPANGSAGGGAVKPRVFISYNHKDSGMAHRIKAFLESKQIPVTIDAEAMQPGEDIQQFINKCIRESDVTLSLVSSNSLLSAWVGMETMNTLAGENIANKKFIAVVIDSAFYDLGFVRNSMTTIDKRLADLKEEMKYRLENDLGFEDLQNERTRNNDLKNDLPKIVANLKNRLNVDISGDNFDAGMERVSKAILG